jgi:hypothetical protein
MKNAHHFSEKLPAVAVALMLVAAVGCGRSKGGKTETKDSVAVNDKPGEVEIAKPDQGGEVTKVDEGLPLVTPLTALDFNRTRAAFSVITDHAIFESGKQRGQDALFDAFQTSAPNLLTFHFVPGFGGPAAFGLFSIAAQACAIPDIRKKLLGDDVDLTKGLSQSKMKDISTRLMGSILGYAVTGRVPTDGEYEALFELGDTLLANSQAGANVTDKFATAACTAIGSSAGVAFY